jgi:CTP synthase (UTP-ammonia lyase)
MSGSAWVAPGSPFRHDDAVYVAIAYARESGTPYLGTCAGCQYAVIEFARSIGLDAGHEEKPGAREDVVVTRLACALYAERRTVTAVPGTRVASACGLEPFPGYLFCGFGIEDAYVERLEDGGLTISARADDAGIVGVELKDHPFFAATLFQPQVGAPRHPLFDAFVTAAGRTPVT